MDGYVVLALLWSRMPGHGIQGTSCWNGSLIIPLVGLIDCPVRVCFDSGYVVAVANLRDGLVVELANVGMQSQVAPFQRSLDASNSGGLSGQAAPVGLGGPLHICPRNGLADALPESDDVSVRDDITCE